jgi:NAD(P)-dependent dehydrogenase (short-subunit alcohol dehydrogenase family)
MDLNNKVAIVTGGASGLGLAACVALIEKGSKVCIFDFNEEAAAIAVSKLGADNATFFKVNVTDESSVTAGIEHCLKIFGELHIVLNSAGIGPPEKVINREGEPLPLDNFKKIVDVNMFGTFNVLSKAAAEMAKQKPFNADNGRGVIINVASVAAFDGQIGQPAYAASKAGIVGMALPIAREFARYGIRVNTIAPGLFLTPLAESLGEKVVEALGNSVEYPKRLGDPKEFAKLVVQIAENDYLNGEVIRLDGAIRMTAR